MPRRRRNRSGGSSLKKVPKLELADDLKRSLTNIESQTQTRARTRGQRSVVSETSSDTKPFKLPDTPQGGSVLEKTNTDSIENADEDCGDTSESVPQLEETGSPEEVAPHYPESPLESREDEKVNISSPASFVDVKLEIDDENEVSFCTEDKGSDNSVGLIKVEAGDCGFQVWKNPVIRKVPLSPPYELDSSIVAEVQRSLNAILPQDWFCKDAEDGFNVMLLSRCKEKAIQRRLFFPFLGGMEVSVHRKPLPAQDVNELLDGNFPLPAITVDSYPIFVETVLKIVEKFWCMEVCGGADQCEFLNLWSQESGGIVDENPYGEIRYKRTFRSLNCRLLVQSHKWRCRECSRLGSLLKRRSGKKKEGTQLTLHVSEKKENSQLVLKTGSSLATFSINQEKSPGTVYILKNENSVPKLSLSVGSDNSYTLKEGVTPKYVLPSVPESKAIRESEEHVVMVSSSAVGQNVSDHSIPCMESKSIVSYEKVGPKTYQTIQVTTAPIVPSIPRHQNVSDNDIVYTSNGKILSELEKCGVPLEDDLSNDLMAILKDAPLTLVQRQFIEKQSELANHSKTCGIRWHPTMVRFALFVRSTSSEKFRTTGMITLPSGKNLFNFSQVLFRLSEFQKAEIKEILKKLYLRLCDLPKTYHVLLLDEIEVCSNLVFQKSNGELIGYVKLSDIKSEMDQLEAYINLGKAITYNPKPYAMLVYLVKGMSQGMRELVGILDATNISAQTVYDKTWDVIGTLEENGVKVIGVVSNGSPTTKHFIALHTPAVKVKSGQVYSTVNLKAPHRLLYFFIDASFLLKEIRNCFEESGSPSPKRKTLTRRDEPIVWRTIVKLFLAKNKSCPNLSTQNVFLNGYSRKRPSYAASVMNAVVAKDLQSLCWTFTTETVNFITQVHDFFQCLLNSDVSEGKPSSTLITPYTSQDDPRVVKLLTFLGYLDDWKLEIDSIPNLSSEEKSRLLLDDEIFQGAEILVKTFKDALMFLLKEGIEEVNPNDFWIEPVGKFLDRGWFGFVQTISPFNAVL